MKTTQNPRVRQAIDLLDRTPQVLKTWLVGLPSELLEADEGPNTFSARDVVAHMAQGEEDDWMPRIRIVLDRGEAQPFEPFDRFAFRTRYAGHALSELVDRFETLRSDNLLALRALRLTEESLGERGTHPELGKVTLGQLLSTWVAHDLAHLGQIARVLAKQRADEVGPWRAYLPILDR